MKEHRRRGLSVRDVPAAVKVRVNVWWSKHSNIVTPLFDAAVAFRAPFAAFLYCEDLCTRYLSQDE